VHADVAARLAEFALEATSDLVSFHDPAGRPFYANAAAREFYGLAFDAPLPDVDLVDILDIDVAQLEELRHSLATSCRWHGELEVVGPNNQRMPVSVVVVSHRDVDGNVDYYAALSRDLSETRANESARRRTEAVLRAIVQSSPLAILAMDARGAVQVWNRASEQLLGWPANEMLGAQPELVGSDGREELGELLERVFAGETIKGHEARLARRHGESIDVDASIAPLRDASGRVAAAVVILADITEHKRAANSLERSEVWFRSLVQNSSDMLMVMAADSTLTYVSPSALEFAGLTSDDVATMRVNEIFAPPAADLAELQQTFARLRATPGAVELATFRLTRADGETRWIELAATNMLDDAAVQGIVINARDVTESFEADAAVRASEIRLRALVSGVSDAISVIGADGKLIYSSPIADEMFGELGATDDAGTVFDALDPDDRPRAIELFEETLATPGLHHPEEVRIRREDGTVIATEVIANNLLDDPSVQGIVMTIRDVTDRKAAEVALRESASRLRESESRYRAVVDDQVELVSRFLPDTTLTFVNRAFADFYGRAPEELIGSSFIDLHPPAARDAELARLGEFGPTAALRTYDNWELAVDGSRRWYRWTVRAFLDDTNEIVEFQAVGRDVTREHRAAVLTANEAQILKQVALGSSLSETLTSIARTIEEHFPKLQCAIFMLQRDGSMLRLGAAPSVSTAFVAALDGLPIGSHSGSAGAAAATGEPVSSVDVQADPCWAQLREVAAEHGVAAAWSTPILAADGRSVFGTVDVYSRIIGEPDEELQRILAMVANLASIAIDRKAFEDQLAHQSMHDPLTELPNRVLFLDRLELAISRCRRTRAQIAVLFVDLDRFKNVNDSFGHDAGDELLVGVARRLADALRPGDTVARFGGDEFTILCEDLPHASARDRAIEIAQRLRASVAQPFSIRDTETFVGLSVGIAIAERGDETPDELLRDADAAMYHAKASGRGRVEVFDETMRARVMARHTTENELHRAIERGELRVFFQPIVSLEEAECIGAEALVRWQHP
jgi:diguanylate cyclase (GGDEF)-like protein/PAS domain S-box-containing protein